MINETKIKCFLSLSKTLNFTVTASMLFMSQQAVSKNIAGLEEDLGFKLFTRSSHSVELTTEGERCYVLISQLTSKFNNTIADIRYNYKKTSDSISMGFQSFLDFGPIPNKVIEFFGKDNPNLKFDIYNYNPQLLIEKLINRNLNLILMNGRFAPKTPDLKILELAKVQLVMMISADKVEVDRVDNNSCESFLNEPFILDSFESESIIDYNKRSQLESETWGLSPSKIVWVPDRDTAYTYAEMGQGYVIGTDMSRISRDRNLISLPIGKQDTLVAIWHEAEEHALVKELAKKMQQEYYKERNSP